MLRARGEDVVGFASRARDGWLALDALPDTPHDVLLHFAFVTREHVADHGPDAYVAANLAITARVLQAVERHRPRMAYASSGAVGLGGDLATNPYGVLKRLDEHAFRDATGARCFVLRVFNVAGPWCTKPTAFALTDLITQARTQDHLLVRARHPVVRSYVDAEDVAALMIAAAGEDATVATAGAEEVEVGDLARRIAPDLPVLRDRYDPDAVPDRYVGDAAGFAAACDARRVTVRGLDEQLARTRDALAGRPGSTS